ncbi:MAG: transcription antitermination factor NusB [Nitriliruptorales bacterium]
MTTEAVHLPRHEARRRALEVLYEADVRRRDITDTLERTISDPQADPLDDFARVLIHGVARGCEEIDVIIASHAHGWTVSRMPIIDRNILRLAVYELLEATDTPAAVVIDEAVELAKEMSTEDSPRYINGVLSAVLRTSRLEGG